ncbi:MAG TPA: hypothetical protein VFH43_07955 [Candidatus Kapabacteria bacterium]|nr:hypothetical protein [Candidatus Kapabacteria bacterium]
MTPERIEPDEAHVRVQTTYDKAMYVRSGMSHWWLVYIVPYLTVPYCYRPILRFLVVATVAGVYGKLAPSSYPLVFLSDLVFVGCMLIAAIVIIRQAYYYVIWRRHVVKCSEGEWNRPYTL